MGIGVSIFLLAVGAVLAFATDVTVNGLDLDAVGLILMGAGVLGLLLSLLVWGPRGREADVVVDDRVHDPGPRL